MHSDQKSQCTVISRPWINVFLDVAYTVCSWCSCVICFLSQMLLFVCHYLSSRWGQRYYVLELSVHLCVCVHACVCVCVLHPGGIIFWPACCWDLVDNAELYLEALKPVAWPRLLLVHHWSCCLYTGCMMLLHMCLYSFPCLCNFENYKVVFWIIIILFV